jgi:hypothetical protein
MKANRGSRGIAPLILNFSARWSWVVNNTPRPFYTPEKNTGLQRIGGWVGTWASLDILEKKKVCCFCWDSNPHRPAHSPVSILTTISWFPVALSVVVNGWWTFHLQCYAVVPRSHCVPLEGPDQSAWNHLHTMMATICLALSSKIHFSCLDWTQLQHKGWLLSRVPVL